MEKPRQPCQHFFLVAFLAAFLAGAAFLVAAPLAAFFATVSTSVLWLHGETAPTIEAIVKGHLHPP